MDITNKEIQKFTGYLRKIIDGIESGRYTVDSITVSTEVFTNALSERINKVDTIKFTVEVGDDVKKVS